MPRNCAILASLALALAMPLAQARVTRIVIDEVRPFPAADSGGIPTEQIAGRAFGELDPASPANAIINDVQLGKDADGKVRYVATFVITKPVDLAPASGLMWHGVPNRGLRRPNVVADAAMATSTSPAPGRATTRGPPGCAKPPPWTSRTG